MPLYLLSMIQPSDDGLVPPPDVLDGIMVEVGRIRDELAAQGAWVFGNGLQDPSAGATVRRVDGATVVTDGPFVEVKEHLGGVTIIEVADRDAAVAWARRYAEATTLPIEVRPFR